MNSVGLHLFLFLSPAGGLGRSLAGFTKLSQRDWSWKGTVLAECTLTKGKTRTYREGISRMKRMGWTMLLETGTAPDLGSKRLGYHGTTKRQ